jgi:hypothetical protein
MVGAGDIVRRDPHCSFKVDIQKPIGIASYACEFCARSALPLVSGTRRRLPQLSQPRSTDLAIMRGQCKPERSGGSDDDPVRWIAMKARRKTIHLQNDRNVEGKDLDHSRRRRFEQPGLKRRVEHQAAALVEHLCLPQRHGRDPRGLASRFRIQSVAFGSGKIAAAGEPPDPDVRIEQQRQRSASKSRCSSTDCSGGPRSSPVPRSRSQGFAFAWEAAFAGSRRATTLPRRTISTTFRSRSTSRMISRHRAFSSVTEMVISGMYMTTASQRKWPGRERLTTEISLPRETEILLGPALPEILLGPALRFSVRIVARSSGSFFPGRE